MKTSIITVSQDDIGKRLDIFLTKHLADFSRSQIQKLLAEGHVRVNSVPAKANYKVKEQDKVELFVPAPRPLEVLPQPLPLDVVYEDRDLLVVNKPQGMVVHPANGNYEGTLVNALLYHCRDLSGINGVLRPGIVHRIDKDTSGLLVVAKNDDSHRHLAQLIKKHEVKDLTLLWSMER